MSQLRTLERDRARADIPDRYTWNLADLFPSLEAWRVARARLETDIPARARFEGTLGRSAWALADALEAIDAERKALVRAYVYAGMLADEDTRESRPQAMRQQMVQLVGLLKDAGVDMTTGEPLDLTMSSMDRVMDEIEMILDRRDGAVSAARSALRA